MPAALGTPFTTSVRVIDRIHRRAANMRTTTKPPFATRLAQPNRHVV
jgi:hypothetical protein